jgi:hypothetical protein
MPTHAAYKEWLEMVSKLPQDPITPEIEQRIEEDLRAMRREEERKARK